MAYEKVNIWRSYHAPCVTIAKKAAYFTTSVMLVDEIIEKFKVKRDEKIFLTVMLDRSTKKAALFFSNEKVLFSKNFTLYASGNGGKTHVGRMTCTRSIFSNFNLKSPQTVSLVKHSFEKIKVGRKNSDCLVLDLKEFQE